MHDEFWLEEMNPDGFAAGDGIMRGDPGPYFTPAVDGSGNISWTNNGNLPNPQTRNIKGPQGEGAKVYQTPAALPSPSSENAAIVVHDEVFGDYQLYSNDQFGWTAQGSIKGGKGDDGVSPTVTVTDITGGHRVTITDAEHPLGQSFDVMDGDISGVGNLAFLNYVVVES